jgi:hypothetical protein
VYFIYTILNNKLKKLLDMSCGCKKNQAQQVQPTKPSVDQSKIKQTNVQESIKKIVEKYYKK